MCALMTKLSDGMQCHQLAFGTTVLASIETRSEVGAFFFSHLQVFFSQPCLW